LDSFVKLIQCVNVYVSGNYLFCVLEY
jgi:hypothetical protein